MHPIEIKSSETLNFSLFEGLIKWSELTKTPMDQGTLIYAGQENQKRKQGQILSWINI